MCVVSTHTNRTILKIFIKLTSGNTRCQKLNFVINTFISNNINTCLYRTALKILQLQIVILYANFLIVGKRGGDVTTTW